jgi:hypothetical protein
MARRKTGSAYLVYTNLVHEALRWAWLLPLALALPATASATGKADKCVAGICLQSSITQKMLVAKYGPGRLRIGPGLIPDTQQRCYYDKQQGLYIEFTFDKHAELNTEPGSDLSGIMVSSVPMCPQSYAPKRPFPKFTTESGLHVGSTAAEVEAALGKTDKLYDVAGRERKSNANFTQEELMRDYRTSVFGGFAWVYIPDPEDLLANYIYIDDGKIKSLRLSDSE